MRHVAMLVVCVVATCTDQVPNGSDGGADATSEAGQDVNSDASGDVEAEAAPQTCDVHAPFTSSTLMNNLTTSYPGAGASFLPNELTVFFPSTSGGLQIFTSTRTSTAADFPVPTPVAELDQAGSNGNPWISPDGRTVYFVSSRLTSATYDLFVASRMTVTATFSTPVEVANVNDPTNNNVAPTVSTDGSELFLSSNRVGNQYRIYHATSSGSAFSTATEVTELTGVDGGGRGLETPVLSDDGLTLYFSVVANADGSGFAFTVWMAQRATVNDPFGNLQAVTEINADSPFSAPAWLSNDACRLYVSQTRADGGTTFNLYVYRR